MMDGPGGGSWTINLVGDSKLVYAGQKLTTLVMPDGSTSPLVAEEPSTVANLPVTDAPSRHLMHDSTQPDGSRLVLIAELTGSQVPNFQLFYGTPPQLRERLLVGIAWIENGIQPEFMVDGVKRAVFLPNANVTTTDSNPPQERLAGLQFQCL